MAKFQHGSLIFSKNIETLTTTKTLVYNDDQLQCLNPSTSDQNIFLPSVSLCEGLPFWIINTSSTNKLKVYDDTTSLITTIIPNDVVNFICNGVTRKADIEISSYSRNDTTKTSNYTMVDSDDVILVDASSGNIQIKLPNPTTSTVKNRDIKRIDSTNNSVTIIPYNTETIDGVSQKILEYQYASITLITNNTNWYMI